MMQTVLVTGRAGFIGLNFIHYQLKTSSYTKIVNLDKLTYPSSLHNLKGLKTHPNYKQLFIPKGFLHGYSSLGEDMILYYVCDEYYNKEAKIVVRFDHPDLDIVWKVVLNNELIPPKDLELNSLLYFKNVTY